MLMLCHCPAQRDMLRLDALIMTVQLNIRRLLEARLLVPNSFK